MELNITWAITNWKEIIELYLSVIGIASIIVKLTPTLKDDEILTNIIKFIGKWIALQKYGPTIRPE